MPSPEEIKTILFEDLVDEAGFGFRVKWQYTESWADVCGWKVVAVEEGRPLFENDGGVKTPLFDACTPYLSGFVQWDGCMEFDQGRPHWCGPRDLKRHGLLLQYIYRRAQSLVLAIEDECPWDATPETMKVVTLPA